MFKSFFPKPGPFFISAFIWSLLAVIDHDGDECSSQYSPSSSDGDADYSEAVPTQYN